MKNEGISYQEARRRAEKAARDLFSWCNVEIDDPHAPVLEQRYEENSVCWIFFRNRSIKIGVREGNVVVHSAFGVDRRGAVLYVNDHFDNEEELREQMARFEALPPENRDRIFGDPKKSE